jgi:hypothetical protein
VRMCRYADLRGGEGEGGLLKWGGGMPVVPLYPLLLQNGPLL